MKLSEKERAELDRAVSEYIMEGGEVTANMFNDKKLLSKLKDKKLIKRVFRANEDFKTRGSKLDRAKSRTDFNNYIDNALTSIKSPDELFSKMIREGNLDQLEELGLIKLTEDGTPIVDSKRYKELISGAFYKESLKYAESSNYKNQWDKQAELDKLSKAKAKERIDNLKNKATDIKDNIINNTTQFKNDLKDGVIEEKIKNTFSEDNIKNKAVELKDEIVSKAKNIKEEIAHKTETMQEKKEEAKLASLDANIEKKIKEVLPKESIKEKSNLLSNKVSDFKVKTLESANNKIDILRNEIDSILTTEENIEKINAAKAKLEEARVIIEDSRISKQVKSKVQEFKASETLDKAKTFTDNVVDNLRNEISSSSPKDLVKSIITVDAGGTAVIERLESEIDRKLPKENLLDTKLELLVEAIEKNTNITEESNEISKDELKASKTTKFNDLNNDGLRDGSFREKMSKVFRTGPKEIEKKKEEENKDKSSGILKTVFGALFSGLGGLVGGLFSGLGGLFGGAAAMFGGLTTAIAGIGTKIIGPLIGGLAALVPGFIKKGFGLAGGLLGGGAKATTKFTKATKKTRGFERKMFGGILKKIGGAALRKLPLIGLLAGGYLGYDMIKGGDMIGGLGTMVSSLLAQIPGIGTALSLGVDSLLMLDRDKKTQDLDIEIELEKKKKELEERNAMMQKANENNWEKEAIMLQNKFDKYTAEQDQIRNKINELENGKFKTDSKEKLLEKEKEKLAKSEQELLEAKKLQTNLDKGMESVKALKDKRDKFLELSKDSKFPQVSKDKFKAAADKLDSKIVVQENKNNEMKKFIDSQNKADNVINKVADPKERLKYAESAREKLIKAMEAAKDPNAVLAMSKAVNKHDEMISKIKAEIADSSVTEEINNSLNVDNQAYKNEQELKKNPDANTKADGTIKTVDEVEADRQRKILEDRIAELEERKIRVNEEAKKRNAGMSGYGTGASQYSSGLGGKSFGNNYYMAGGSSRGMGSYDSGDISIADEITIAKNSYKGGDVKKIINAASDRAGIDNTLMQVMAAKESSFRVDAKAPRSSALGLYQFLNGTWKEAISKYGPKYDLGMSNASRLNPEHSTLMAAEYLKANLKHIKGVKPNPNITDAYLTHFLGPGGAKKLLTANPDESAERVVGKAAVNANPGIFIGNGRIKTVREAYDTIAKQLAKTAGQFGIKISKEDVGGSSGVSIFKPNSMPIDPAKELASTNTVGPDTPSVPNRPSNELAGMTGITGGHSSNTVAPNIEEKPKISPVVNTDIPKDMKQAIHNNGVDKLAKDEKDRKEQLAVAEKELDKRKTSYSTPQEQINNMDPFNNISDSSFKSLIISTKSLAKANEESVAKLDTIAKNTGDTVAVLQKIHDKLDNLNSGNNNTKANNQSSNIVTKGAENAISLQRGTSVK